MSKDPNVRNHVSKCQNSVSKCQKYPKTQKGIEISSTNVSKRQKYRNVKKSTRFSSEEKYCNREMMSCIDSLGQVI